MPKRTDLNRILVIGSGPLSSDRQLNSTMPERRRVLHFERKAMKSYYATPIRRQL